MSQPHRYNFYGRITHLPGGEKDASVYAEIKEDGFFVQYNAYAAMEANRDMLLSEVYSLRQEADVLTAKVDWLMKAEHLLIWDGAAWKVRPEHLPR